MHAGVRVCIHLQYIMCVCALQKLIREEWEALQSKEMEDEEKKRVERERKEVTQMARG